MANLLPGFGAVVGGTTVPVAPQNRSPLSGNAPSGVFAGSNLQYVSNTGTKRQLLQRAGYSVDTAGPETARLNQAWDNYFKTKGLGAAAWNITPTQFDPTIGGQSNAKKLAAAKGGRTSPKGTTTTTTSAADQVPGAVPAVIPGSPNFENLYAGVNAP